MNVLMAVILMLQAGTVRVLDPWNLPIPNATVRIGGFSGTTNDSGELAIPDEVGDQAQLEVEATGFQTDVQEVSRWTGVLEVRLRLTSVMSGVTVTATRDERIAGESAASVTILDAEAVRTAPSRAIDDLLRQIPGFSLLRRTSSVAAHPTSQGVSMRGIGASGASRTLVLADGVPLNDAFGSWVYWNRVPKLAIDSIEVVRGGASDLYGSSAVGGVVQLLKRRPSSHTVLGELTYGQRDQVQGSLYISDVRGNWGYSVAAESFRTDGYLGIAPAERGTVDREFASSYRTVDLYVERRLDEASRIFGTALFSTEDRKNGTQLTGNDTNFRQFVLGADVSHAYGRTTYRVFGGSEAFDSSFSAITLNRTREVLTSTQAVPLGYGGFDGHTLLVFDRHAIVAGAGFRRARGMSHEIQFRAGGPVANHSGGRQDILSVFAQDLIRLNSFLSLGLSARWDRWTNLERIGVPNPTQPSSTVGRADENALARWNPKVALTARVRPELILRAAAYAAFRAPTLNELYRPFSVGNTITLANPQLGDERLRGMEVGVENRLFGGRVHTRVSGYWSIVKGTVANITLVNTSQSIVRQRANLGSARARGLEVEAEVRPLRRWSLTGSYLYSDSTVLRFPSNRTLEGLRLPQVPQHQFSASSQVGFGPYRVNLQARTSGLQFDNDQNTLILDKYFNMDAYFSRAFGSQLDLFVAGENLTDADIQVAKTPATTLAMPRSVRVGLSFRLGVR